MAGLWDGVRGYLPRGNMLDPETFHRRHLLLCWVLALHIPALGIFGVTQGYELGPVLLEMATPLVCLIAARAVENRRLAAFFVTAGLVFCSSVLVHFSGGMIEAHFHFFVIIGLIALYQDWVPFLWNVVFTVLSHGLGSAFAEDSMFNHHAGIDNPWTWAMIHGIAVLAASIGVMIFWKNTELEQQRSGRLAMELAASEVHAAQQEASQRRSVSDLLVNLARRNQGLLDRQLALIADLEQRQRDPEPLAELFQLDHLATRIRRNAESLLVLSGDEPARLWGNPQPLAEVVRAAAAEIEHYQRVDVEVNDYLDVAGQIVADLAHLLAELIENATTFSPPNSRVRVRSHIVPSEWSTIAVSVEDTGMGMSDADMTSANQILAYAPEVDLRSSTLGFHVVSRLASRYGLQVRLAHTPGGGVTGLVALPNHLVTERTFPAIPAAPVEPLPLPPPPPPPLVEPERPRALEQPPPPPPPPPPVAEEPPAAVVEPAVAQSEDDSLPASVPDDLPVGAGAPSILEPLDEPAAFEPPPPIPGASDVEEPAAPQPVAVEPEPVAADDALAESVRTPPFIVPEDGRTEALPVIPAPTVKTGVVRTPPYVDESVLDKVEEEDEEPPSGPAPIVWRWKDGKRVDHPEDETPALHLRRDDTDADTEPEDAEPTAAGDETRGDDEEADQEPDIAATSDEDVEGADEDEGEPEDLPQRTPGEHLTPTAEADDDDQPSEHLAPTGQADDGSEPEGLPQRTPGEHLVPTAQAGDDGAPPLRTVGEFPAPTGRADGDGGLALRTVGEFPAPSGLGRPSPAQVGVARTAPGDGDGQPGDVPAAADDGELPRRQRGAALPPLLATPLPEPNGAAATPPAPPPAPEAPRTSAGLARRIPGKALAPALRRQPKSDDGDTSHAGDDDPLADRERVRSMLSQFQAGQMAARAAGPPEDPPGGPGRQGHPGRQARPGPDSESTQ